MQAGDRLMNSPINPLVRAQMKEGIARAQAGLQNLQYAQTLTPQQRFLLGRQTTQGYEQISPAEAGAKVFPYFQPKLKKSTGGKPEPSAPSTAPGTGSEPQEATTPPKKYPVITDEPKNLQPDQQPKLDPETNLPIAETDTSDFYAHQGGLVVRGYDKGGSVSDAPPGPPPAPLGPFLNPATGNYEPIQQPPIQASPFARPGPTPPPAPVQPPQQPQPNQTMLANQQNPPGIHPVISSQDVLELAKHWNTGVQSVAYHPMGPNGPQYSLFGKNGTPLGKVDAATITQLSPGLVAGSNTGTVMQVAANSQQPQPGTPSPQAIAAARQQANQFAATGGPPPGGPPPQTNQPGNMLLQPPAAPGPPPGQPPQGPGAYNAAAYQMPQGPTITQSGDVNPALMAGGSDEQALAAAKAAAMKSGTHTADSSTSEVTPLSADDKAVFTPEAIANARAQAKIATNQPANDDGDPRMDYDLGPWHIYRDDKNKTGELYAVRPGLSSLFKQQRYYLGSDGWQEYELPNTNMRMNVEAEYGGRPGGVGGAPCAECPGGKYPVFNHDQIVNMSVPAMQNALKLAGNYHNTSGEPNSNMTARLDGLANISKRMQRVIDGVDVAIKAGIDPTTYGRQALKFSQEAQAAHDIEPPGGFTPWWNPLGWVNLPEMWNRLGYSYHAFRAEGHPINRFGNRLAEEKDRINDAMDPSNLPGRKEALIKPETTSAQISTPWGSGSFQHTAEGKNPNPELERVFGGTGTTQKNVRDDLAELKRQYDKDFEDSYADAVTHNFRLTPQQVAYHNALIHRVPMPDRDVNDDSANPFRDHQGHLTNPYDTNPKPSVDQVGRAATKASASPAPQPGPTPRTDIDTEAKARGLKSGTRYMAVDPQDGKMKEWEVQ